MYGINRFEAHNYMNGRGDDPNLSWAPRFAGTVLPFYCGSTALRLENGGGKTSIANALVGLVSGDRGLMRQVKSCFPPQREDNQFFGHVRVEVMDIEPDALDTIAMNGESPHGEAWVFGFCGYRGANSPHHYYYYPGRLEDAPTWYPGEDGKLIVVGDKPFRDSVRAIRGGAWGVTHGEYLDRIRRFVAEGNAKQIAEYQKAGGGDKSSQFFKVRNLPGEKHDETFFYDILAPRVMAGIMGQHAEPDEHSLEDTLYKTLSRSIKTQYALEQTRQRAERYAGFKERTGRAAEHAREARGHQQRYQRLQRQIGVILAAIRELVVDNPLPGVPAAHWPSDRLEAALARHTILVPRRGRMIRDAGLAEALGLTSRQVNEIASRNDVIGSKVTRVIENTYDLESINTDGHGGRRHAPTCYEIEDARQLLEAVSSFPSGYTRRTLDEALLSVEDWLERALDRNPVRAALADLDNELGAVDDELKDLGDEVERLRVQMEKLTEEVQAFEEGEDAYRRIQASEHFEPGEADRAGELVGRIEADRKDADQAWQRFCERQARLEPLVDDWKAYVAAHGQDATPDEVERAYEQARQEAEQAVKTAESERGHARQAVGEANDASTRADKAHGGAQDRVDKLEQLRVQRQRFTKAFPGEVPAGFEQRCHERQTELVRRVADLANEIARLRKGRDALFAFRQNHPDGTDPDTWLREAEARREAAQIERSGQRTRLQDLRAQLADLEAETVAPDRAYRQALAALREAGIAVRPVHQVIDELELAAQRRRQVLTQFDAVNFAPVAADASTAVEAAGVLEAAGIRLPCFVAPALAGYARNGKLEDQPAEGGRHAVTGLMAGRHSRQVACLLDPTLLEREREWVAQEIEQAEAREAELGRTIDSLAPGAREVVNARDAAQALADDVENRLPQAESEQSEAEEEQAAIEQRLSAEWLPLIRDAEAFEAQGGERVLREAVLRRDRAAAELEDARERARAARRRLETAETALDESKDRVRDAFPDRVRYQIQQARRFLADNGIAWLAHGEHQAKALREAKERADARAGFSQLLSQAAAYVRIRDLRDEGRSIKDELAGLRREDKLKRGRIDELERQAKDHRARRRELVRAVDATDDALAALLVKYRETATFAEDLPSQALDPDEIASSAIHVKATALRRGLESGESKHIVAVADEFHEQLNELNLDSERKSLQDCRRQAQEQVNRMMTIVGELRGERGGLPAAQRELLMGVDGLEQAEKVERLAEHYVQAHAELECNLERLENDAHRNREEEVQRMRLLIRGAMQNLRILQRVLGRVSQENALRFKVRVESVKDDEAVSLIEEIRAKIKPDVVALHQKIDGHHISESQAIQEDDRILETIRKMCYRRLFKSPRVYYASPVIRQDGEFHRLTRAVSNGQKTAMTLAWLVRLTEFAAERDAGRYPSAAARKSARENQQTLVVIDGMFSDLSKDELIDAGLAEIGNTRGSLQVIGFIHLPEYTNRFEYFPTFLIGREKRGGDAAWTEFWEQRKPGAQVEFAGLRMRKSPSTGVAH